MVSATLVAYARSSRPKTCTGGGGTYQGDGSTCSAVNCPILLTPYVDALPIPAVATPTSGTIGGAATYTITMREFQQQLQFQ